MAEYIDRDTLRDSVESIDWYSVYNGKLTSGAKNSENALYKANDIYSAIENAPAADVVEVTRCKDCRHHSAAAGVCNLYLHFSVGVSANDYCSFGERRTV